MKNLINTLFLVIVLTGCTSKQASLNTVINNDIDVNLQTQIEIIKTDFIEYTINKDYESLKTLLSPVIYEMDNFDLEEFISQISPYFENLDFVIKDQYLSKIKRVNKDSLFTIHPSKAEDKLIINNMQFLNKESYSAFYTTGGAGRDYQLFLNFTKYKDGWKIDNINIGNYGIKGMTPVNLYNESQRLLRLNRPISAIFYTLPIEAFINPAPFLAYNNEAEYMTFFSESVTDIQQILRLPFSILTIEIIGIDYALTDKDGIIPVFLYKTDTELNEEALLTELDGMLDQIKSYSGYLFDEFSTVAMRAYNEVPANSSTSYSSFTVILPKL